MYTPSSFLADEPFFQSCSLDCSWKCISKQSNNNRSKDFLFSISHCSSSIQAYEAASVSTINPTKTFFLWIFFFLSIVCISVCVMMMTVMSVERNSLTFHWKKVQTYYYGFTGPKKYPSQKEPFFHPFFCTPLAWHGLVLSSVHVHNSSPIFTRGMMEWRWDHNDDHMHRGSFGCVDPFPLHKIK